MMRELRCCARNCAKAGKRPALLFTYAPNTSGRLEMRCRRCGSDLTVVLGSTARIEVS